MPPRLSRGVFITLEGGDGSGKSTQGRALAGRLRAEGYRVCLTREPAGTALGRYIWAVFEQGGVSITPVAELLLFAAARAQHVAEVVRPALERGDVVLCDRFADSTLAYQGYGRGLDLDQIRACIELSTGGLKPDVTLLLDLPPEVGLARADTQHKTKDAIGQESLGLHRHVRDGYLQLAREDPERFVVIDAALPPVAATEVAWESVLAALRRLE